LPPRSLLYLKKHHMTGAEFLHAFILGTEVECRLGKAIYASHYVQAQNLIAGSGRVEDTARAGNVPAHSRQSLVNKALRSLRVKVHTQKRSPLPLETISPIRHRNSEPEYLAKFSMILLAHNGS
jgi:hypothetical protein